MQTAIIAGIFSLLGTAVGALVSYVLSRQQFAIQLALLREQHKTEYMAEEAAKHYLGHPNYTDRSFAELEKRLGGYSGDDLRRLLVRAGAVRLQRKDGSEWWRLLSRNDEAIARREMSATLGTESDRD
jgi:hypothetical protein